MVDIQSGTAGIRRGKKKRRRKKEQTTGQKYNVRICYTKGGHKNQVNINTRMWANAQRDGRLPNIDDALSSTPQSLAGGHY